MPMFPEHSLPARGTGESLPAPTVGQKLELKIHDIAFGGEGVARHGDLVIFTPFVTVGETMEAEIIDLKKNYGRARLLRVITPSDKRVAPRCPYFGVCGGCQYQHIAYPEQLRIKHKQISDLFQRVGKFPDTAIEPVIPCPREYEYRNRIMIRSQWNKQIQGLEIGFIRWDSNWVVSIDHCPISEPELNEQIQYVRQNPPPKGGLKVVIRKFPPDWEVPQDSFFQNNFFLLPELVRVVREAFKGGGSRYLIDLYCGVGFFGIELAGLAEAFVGVELDKKAILAARHNAARRGITNGEFHMGNADEWLPKVMEKFPAGETTILLDPPRTGCPPQAIDYLRKIQPRQIIYVSCHPATLARDLKNLCEGGLYALQRITPLDMFPQTQHVECVADLRLALLQELA